MGSRYRKSFNLGGGTRLNVSKSGIGYSTGVKGARVTKTAKGTTRTTLSVPGTGLSYVSESSSGKMKQASGSSSGGYDRLAEGGVYDLLDELGYTWTEEDQARAMAAAEAEKEAKRAANKKIWRSLNWVMAFFFLAMALMVNGYPAKFLAIVGAALNAPSDRFQNWTRRFVPATVAGWICAVLTVWLFIRATKDANVIGLIFVLLVCIVALCVIALKAAIGKPKKDAM